MTTAERIAEQLGNNGLAWQTPEGVYLDHLADQAGGELCEHPTKHDVCRWVFPDGSVITAAGEAWDLGFATCWCWAGAPDIWHPEPNGECDRDPYSSDNNP